jgi:hypothetical protein
MSPYPGVQRMTSSRPENSVADERVRRGFVTSGRIEALGAGRHMPGRS